eukprot:CAMPEP_0204583140 /NCGR_PEP_ID=MMETSP0661-20131031/45608_1 /ASSEMBLY_ACC=CAM_ASM_000606 /TAXON_ID=109239 /ORGANISM="Alexandrium margalefi, Strain AMGDE01CS-322" /LENGTH=200 /DNA_ID=CAMNT_0051592473 /DNA_START=15 /DNA_END=619 /DNA_ORIENTATION=-
MGPSLSPPVPSPPSPELAEHRPAPRTPERRRAARLPRLAQSPASGVVPAALMAGPAAVAVLLGRGLVPVHGVRDHLVPMAALALVGQRPAGSGVAGVAHAVPRDDSHLAAHVALHMFRVQGNSAILDDDVLTALGALPHAPRMLADQRQASEAELVVEFSPGQHGMSTNSLDIKQTPHTTSSAAASAIQRGVVRSSWAGP